MEADIGSEGDLPLARSSSSSKAARPKRLQYDDLDNGFSDDDGARGPSAAGRPRRAHVLADIAEGEEEGCDGYDDDGSNVELSESDEDPPSQYSSPLKTAYSRQALHMLPARCQDCSSFLQYRRPLSAKGHPDCAAGCCI